VNGQKLLLTVRNQRRPKQQKEKLNMKNQNGQYTTTIVALVMALAFTCASSSTVKAEEEREPEGGAIVGLWEEHYTSDFGPQYNTYSQWHSDGLEIESPDFSLGQCQGTFKNIGARTFKLFHVGWLPGGGPNGSVRFELRELNTVSRDRNSFDGTYDQKFFDANGILVMEDTGTIHATRLSVNQFADQPAAAAIK
jgi:hypothetical protein